MPPLPPTLTGYVTWAAEQSPTSTFLNNGVLGAFCVVLLAAVGFCVQMLVKAYNREKDRADRLEAAIEKNYMGALSEAIDALKDALASVRKG